MRSAQFRDITEQLLDAGVAPRRVRRLVGELSDHFDDLVAELSARGSVENVAAEAAARLHAHRVVESALAEPGARSWIRRWPWVAFTALPIALFAFLFVTALVGLVAFLEFAKAQLGLDLAKSPALLSFSQTYLRGVIWILPTIAAAVCCGLALSRRASAVWAVIGAALTCVAGAVVTVQLQMPPGVSMPALNAGVGFRTDALFVPATRVLATLGVVLPVYFWCRRIQQKEALIFSA